MNGSSSSSFPEISPDDPVVRLPLRAQAFPLSTLSIEWTVKKLLEQAKEGRGRWLVTLNWQMVAMALRDRSYETLLAGADRMVADGAAVVWALKRLNGFPVVARIAGVDLVHELLNALATEKWARIAIVGGKDIHQALARVAFPREGLVFVDESPLDDKNEADLDRLAKDLSRARASFIFLALGAPKQDRVAHYLRSRLTGGVLLGIGGSFDYLGGRKRRAPLWMQKASLEWLWRLITEPRLIPRYLVEYPLGFLLFGWHQRRALFKQGGTRGNIPS